LKQQHKIDVVVALSMACLAAVRGEGKPGYDLFAPGLTDDNADDKPPWTEPINLPLGYTRETYEAELARRARIYANWGKTT
jgi:hypothetical protein